MYSISFNSSFDRYVSVMMQKKTNTIARSFLKSQVVLEHIEHLAGEKMMTGGYPPGKTKPYIIKRAMNNSHIIIPLVC